MRADAVAVARASLDTLIVGVRNTGVDTDVRPALEIKDDAGILHCFPRRLEEQALLRIDVRRLARRDAEKLRIELVDAVNETSPLGDALAGKAGLGIIIAIDLPAVGRDLDHRVFALEEKLPEGLDVIQSSGKAYAHADDGDVVSGLRRAVGLLHGSGNLKSREKAAPPPEQRVPLEQKRDPV